MSETTGTADGVAAETATEGSVPRTEGRLDPGGAAAGLERWRKALANVSGAYPGGPLDEPRHRLTLLKTFGSTRRLADLCLRSPATAADALILGPLATVDSALRDLAQLNGGVGAPDTLHAVLAPIKDRVDVGLGLAEIGGALDAAEAAAARTNFAERAVEASLAWLLRAAVARGELELDLAGGGATAPGVFALAGGDFAHSDLTPTGPLDVAVFFDLTRLGGKAASMAERAFVRISQEFEEALQGRTGAALIYALSSPLGAGVTAAGFAEKLDRVRVALGSEQEVRLRAFLATARVVAGDRKAGGDFLEEAEAAVWGGSGALSVGDVADARAADDARAAFRRAADCLRTGLGAFRPVFRTASQATIFNAAGEIGALTPAAAARLVAAQELIARRASLCQLINGETRAVSEDEREALAALCGFADRRQFETVCEGAYADARNAEATLQAGPRAAFARYAGEVREASDAERLQDLGFAAPDQVRDQVDSWSALAADAAKPARFSAAAPGLLTDFGQAQHPNEAAALFDRMVAIEPTRLAVMDAVRADGIQRRALVDALGSFGAATAPLTASAAGVEALLRRRGGDVAESGAEWVARAGAPSPKAKLAEISEWRRQNVARIALAAAAGDISFDVAVDALQAVHDETLRTTFTSACPDGAAREQLALYVVDAPRRGLPGVRSVIGFTQGKDVGEAGEAAARCVVDALCDLDRGYFALTPDVAHRPGGAGSGPLAATKASFRAYIQSEAIASDQILFARARVVAGAEAAQREAEAILRAGVANPKRADILLRDLDRARAQRRRSQSASSPWELDRVDGGLADVEMIISTLVYRHAGALPALQAADAGEALAALERAGLVSPDMRQTLCAARRFFLRLELARAFARWSDPQKEPVRPRFAALLARAAEVERFAQIRPLMRGYAEDVNRLYSNLVLGRPAASLAAVA